MYNRRVRKTDRRVEAYGSVDELNAALGLARASSEDAFVRDNLLRTQSELVTVMGELATLPEDLERYKKDGFKVVLPEMAGPLEQLIKEIEAQKISFKGWATPGGTPNSAALDMARTICRRAERQVWGLMEAGEIVNEAIPIFLNRLSDLLWLMARWVETKANYKTLPKNE
jgi:cob(I)alamin adenosyltransferase